VADGRLKTVEDFENIVVRTEEQGGVVRIKDVGRVEIGENNYGFFGTYNGGNSVGIQISQKPGSNAIKAMDGIQKTLERLREQMPEDMEIITPYDATRYVRSCVREIQETLLITFALVVFVCYLFLQDVRATLVPAITIPVSLCGTFAAMGALGYSINTLTLFGLVLAVGSIVDDAIVVIERVQYLMQHRGFDRKRAAETTMKEVTSPIVATTLVLLGIFLPVAFIPGITGKVYQQFAVTMCIAISFSTLNALTLSPAICATCLGAPRQKRFNVFVPFNWALEKSRGIYLFAAVFLARRIFLSVVLLVGTILLAYAWFLQTPSSFLPEEDQGVIFADVRLPEGAIREDTQIVQDQIYQAVKDVEGVNSCQNITGFSITGGRAESTGLAVFELKPWSDRTHDPKLHASVIMDEMRKRCASIKGATLNFFMPPSIPGLGVNSGLELYLQSLDDPDPLHLDDVLQGFLQKINGIPGVQFAFSGFTAKTPNIKMDVDRVKCEMLGVPVAAVFATLQNYFGSYYVNDINLGTQVNQVIVQADFDGRRTPEEALKRYVRSNKGEMVQLGSLVTIKRQLGPRLVPRFNQYPAAGITVRLLPGAPSSLVMSRLETLAKEELPKGYTYDWSGLSFQEKRASGQTMMLMLAAVVFGYLFLVAQYESWTIPMPVMLSIFVAVAGAFAGLRITGMTLSIYAQLGLILLVALASKNAILMVEFSKVRREAGYGIIESAAAGAGQRYRAVLMTALTFVLGVLPLVYAKGAGAAARQAIGVSVFSGMLAATFIGIIFVPGLYVVFQTLREKVYAVRARFGGKGWGEK
jgi:HAE1 family hydrophobic/amphiphilic exporter-1/multidrug efflux pump